MTINTAVTTHQNSYDDPAYRAPVFFHADILAAANSNNKFVATTTMLIKSVTVTCTLMGTCGGSDIANGSIYVSKVIGGTGTQTYALNTWGTTGAGFTNGTFTATQTFWPVANSTLAAGDMLIARKGTDASLTAAVMVEMYVAPGASLTV